MLAELHPSEAVLHDFLLGKLPDAEHEDLESHLSGCDACQTQAASLQTSDTLVGLLTATYCQRQAAVTPSSPGPSTSTFAWPLSDSLAAGAADLPAALADHPRYRPVRLIGSGGMGSVWLAEHALMGREVAVKVIRPDRHGRPQTVERFVREIQAVGKLDCAHIVRAHDAERIGDVCLLVMEYVAGVTLSEVLQAGPLPAAEACRAARDAAKGLAVAHAAGLIHRDIKPSNLIRTADGTTKVLDFGLATAASCEATGAGPADGAPPPPALTADQMVIGTPDYIAPEQIAAAADARADVYALGCTLYHLLAGRVPFPADSVLRKIESHGSATELPDPLAGVPARLATVVARMMAKNPADRVQTAAEVAALLEPFCEDRRAGGVNPPVSWARRRLAIGAAAAAVALAAAGVVYRIHRNGNDIITVETDDPAIEVTMKRNGDLVRIVDTKAKKSWELDAKAMRLQSDGGELSIDLPGREPLVLRRVGRAVATVRREAPPVAPIAPEAKLPLKSDESYVFRGHTDGLLALAVSPDGRYAATGGSYPNQQDGALRLWNLRTGAEVRQFHGHDHYAVHTVFNVAFSPDGKRLLSGSSDGTARLWDVERGAAIAWLGVVRPNYMILGVAFTPDGKQAVVASEKPRLYNLATNADLERFENRVVEQVRAAAVSPNGTTLATGERNGDEDDQLLSLWDVKTGKRFKALAGHRAMVYAVAWSPDGKRVASASADGTARIWDAATGQEVRRLNHPRAVQGIAYSPGGRYVLTGGQDHAVRLWDAATGQEVHTLKGHDLEVWTVAFAPDGKHALSVSQDKTLRMWRLPDALVDPK